MNTPTPGDIYMKQGETRAIVREVVAVTESTVQYVEGRSLSGRRTSGWTVNLERWNNWLIGATKETPVGSEPPAPVETKILGEGAGLTQST